MMLYLTDRAGYLAESMIETGRFKLLSEIRGNGLPLDIWRLNSEERYDGKDSSEARHVHDIVPNNCPAAMVQHTAQVLT